MSMRENMIAPGLEEYAKGMEKPFKETRNEILASLKNLKYDTWYSMKVQSGLKTIASRKKFKLESAFVAICDLQHQIGTLLFLNPNIAQVICCIPATEIEFAMLCCDLIENMLVIENMDGEFSMEEIESMIKSGQLDQQDKFQIN